MSNQEENFAFQLRALGLDGWAREVKFHPTRKWRFDFYNADKKLAVEIEGGVYTNGRHTRGSGFVKDIEKYNTAAEMGICVLRYASHMVANGEAIAQVERVVKRG